MEKTHFGYVLQLHYKNKTVGKFSLTVGTKGRMVYEEEEYGNMGIAATRSPVQITLWGRLRESKSGCTVKGLVTLLPAKPLAEERVRRVHVNTKLTGRRLTPKFKEGVMMTENLRWFLENVI